MPMQSFPVGDAPRILIGDCRGDLRVELWDERAVAIESDSWFGNVSQTDEAVVIERANGDLTLRLPHDADLAAERVAGDLDARGLRALSATYVGGDAEIDEIEGDVQLGRVGGDLTVRDTATLRVAERVGGDAEIGDVAQLEIEQVDGDAALDGARSATLGNIGGDLSASGGEALRYRNVGGDLSVDGAGQTVVAGEQVGGDCAIHAAASVQIGSVGGDCAIHDVGGELRLGSVGGDCAIHDVAGSIRLGSVGGDASIEAERSDVRLGNVGGDLSLDSAFPAGSVTSVNVGGDASIALPRDANLTLRATVGGDISGERIVSSGAGMFTAVYGEGAAQLDLMVGGDLALHGGGAPRSSSASWDWGRFGEDMGRMGEEIGREFSNLGNELGRELSAAFGPGGEYSGERWQRKLQRQIQEQVRRAEHQAQRAQHAAEASQRRAEHTGRVHVRINDREWRFDAERLERLKQQAREAAREGISGAMAAVDRALAGLGVPPTPAATWPRWCGRTWRPSEWPSRATAR
ncbi:MAG TPA: hypothetical protein PKK15_10295 [Kouleothrix sp.]|nr:hypothetical protein [Kouleothrix sp.]